MAKVNPMTVNIWTARCIPFVLMGIVGYATYVLVVRLCVDYLLQGPTRRPGAVIAILVIYFLLFLLMATAYFRVLYIVTFDPGFIPLGQVAPVANGRRTRRVGARDDRSTNDDGLGREYGSTKAAVNWHTDADAPGLEEFYSKDVFVCEQDGKPKWCTECGNWKPDRTHHCSDVGRCVRKMDHFCPWVGGVVAENSFKFFIQFVFYACTYCMFLVIVLAIYLHEQLDTPNFTWYPEFAAILGLAAFFGLFTGGMTGSSFHFAIANLTTIENLNRKTKAWQLAVFIPNRWNPPGISGIPDPTVTYPLPLATENSGPGTSESDFSNRKTSQAENPQIHEHRPSERDLKATRSFALLRMEPGRSPWDLGAMSNWKSVMGNNFLDWFLPVNRSPCCNHESDVSQFALGAHFERLKVDHGLASEKDIRSPRPFSGPPPRRHSRRRSRDVKMQKYVQPP